MTTLPQYLPFYGGGQVPNPANVKYSTGAPSTVLTEDRLGTLDVSSTGNVYGLVSKTGGVNTWAILGGATGAVATINSLSPVAGNIIIAPTANQIGVANAGHTVTLSLPAAIIAPGSIASTTTIASGTTLTGGTGIVATTGNISATAGAVNAGTSMTATLGNITATNGQFVGSTAGTGFLFNANSNSGAASGPVVLNSRAGQVTFTTVSIAAGASLTLTMTNSAITGSGTQIIYSMFGATAGAALSIVSVTNSAGSSAIVVTNGTGATTTTANISFNFLVVN